MNNILEMYKNVLVEYINKFGILELVCNFVVALGLVAIYLRVYSNFKDAENQKSFEKKKVKSAVETFSMTAFFAICTIVVLYRIGSLELGSYVIFLKVIAIFIYIFGVFVNLYGRKCLGTNWGNNVVIYLDHKLIDTGIYGYVRHPLYASIIWMLYSVGMMYENILIIILTTFVFIPSMYYRAKQEETELEKVFKEKYVEYRKKVGMFFPKFIMRK
ncbi:MAG: isoprenylcysteine carboxylmethyltransferase family protein [Clostridia bacterium]|nr:isoprenylcysteine carboxylmethyltransferase family protein [Clostridia bacterium]MDD4387053.1 isoprenylcysteine carboxylmethyltransferase family protein [Clostridia bacterium]